LVVIIVVGGVDACDRDEGGAEVANLGEQTVQLGLVHDGAAQRARHSAIPKRRHPAAMKRRTRTETNATAMVAR
jgi:hypothetical protein